MIKCFTVTIIAIFLSLQAFATDIPTLIWQFQADKSALSRKYTLKESEEFYDRFEKLYADYHTSLSEVDFASLSHSAQVDFILLKNHLDKELYQLKLDRGDFEKVKSFGEFLEPLRIFIVDRRRGNHPESEKIAEVFQAQRKELAQQRKGLESNEQKLERWQLAEKASGMVAELGKNLEEAFKFYDGYDPEFSWWVTQPYENLKKDLEVYAEFLKDYYSTEAVKDDGSGIIGRPIGREAIIESLGHEFIPYTPEELVEIAEKEFAWSEKQMLYASRELGFGDDWKAALEHVKGTYFPVGEWPAEINRMAEEAVEFLEERDVITIPEMAKETWRMRMMSPAEQRFAPFFLGGEVIQIAYPTDEMSHEEKMMSLRGNNPHFSRAVVHHELIPGHHLQQFMNQRHKTHRRLFYTPFWTEGWALYWEFNLWDKDFPRNAEDRIGMMFWRMHRSARIIFSLNYHMEKMTPQESIDFLVERVGHERANAEAEVRRSFEGRYGPLYQIAYMTGGLQFYHLKKELVDNGQMGEKEFHDRIMQENSIPVALVRAILKEEPLSRDEEVKWRFYE
ncbi:DUF885 family protein [Litoribacter alkaliphilus]|uniref:DUF885 family protein n=1 Tax=Litoribacter ruber TaxID=702568 RepID=A0AAP2G198_9BACT|nr:DUF885 family protein [Litoribacter alkaliphilus]MBS9523792.1 DUF885 family protein [Litoribacter alkaliphilus]